MTTKLEGARGGGLVVRTQVELKEFKTIIHYGKSKEISWY